MKFTELINKHWKNFTIMALAILLFLAFRSCKGEKNRNQKLVAADEVLNNRLQNEVALRLEGRKEFDAYKKDTEGRKLLSEAEKQEADKKVQAQQKTIDRLAATVRLSGTITKPPEGVIVSADYKAACDSLPAEIDKLNIALADKDSAINQWSDILAYEIQLRDEEIFKEMNYSDSLLVAFHNQRALFNQAMKSGKPRGRLLGGISVLGNEKQFLSGAGVVIAYQTKGGKQYQISPKFIKVPGGSAEVFYEGAVLFTIFR